MTVEYQEMIKSYIKIKNEISSGAELYKKSDIIQFQSEFSAQLKKATDISEEILKKDLGDFKKADLKNLRDDLSCWESWHQGNRVRPADLVKKIDAFLAEKK